MKNLYVKRNFRLNPNKKISKKLIIILVVAGLAFVLQHIHVEREVTLHLEARQMSFYIPDLNTNLMLLESIPVSSIRFGGFTDLPLEVKNISEDEKPLIFESDRIILKALSSESHFQINGNNLRLKYLSLSSGSKVKVYTDRRKQMLMKVDNTENKKLAIDTSDKKFYLTVKDVIILDDSGRDIQFNTNQVTHTLNVTTFFHNLVFEQQEKGSLDLVINFTDQMEKVPIQTVDITLAPRLKISKLDFTRTESNRKITGIHRMWIDPILSEKKSVYDVFIDINQDEIFTLQYLGLSDEFLVCRLSGSTDSIKVGKDKPHKNVIPPLLSSLLYSKNFNKLIDSLKGIKEIIQ